MRACPQLPRVTALIASVVLVSCAVGDSPTSTADSGRAALTVQPAIVASAANGSAAPVNRIRATTSRVADNVLLDETEVDVDPNASEWDLTLSIPISSESESVYVFVLLLNVSDAGEETIQFSGRSDATQISVGEEATPEVLIVRGPIANLFVTSVTVTAAPDTLFEAFDAPLSASATTEGATPPTLFWTSLDTSVATLAADTVIGISAGTVDVVASAGAFADTVQIIVTPAPVSTIEVTPAESDLFVGASLTLTADLRDARGNPLTGRSVTWSSSDVAVASVESDGIVTGVEIGAATVYATSGSVTDSARVTVIPPPSDTVFVVSGGGQTAPAGTTLPAPLVLQVQFADGSPLVDTPVRLTTLEGGSISPDSANTDANGQLSATWTLGPLPGTQSVLVEPLALPGITTTASAEAVVGAAASVSFVDQPTNTVVGDTIRPPISVEVTDAAGNRVTSVTDSVRVAIADNPSGGVLAGSVSVAAIEGLATFDDLSIDLEGVDYTLEASADGLAPDTSNAFTIDPATPQARWISPTSGNWSDGANWSTGAPPAPDETVVVDQPGVYTITLNTSDSVAALELTNPDAELSIAVTASSVLKVVNGGTNAGTITITGGSTANTWASELHVTTGTLLNTGTIRSTVGARAGARTLRGNVDNQGTIAAVNRDLQLLGNLTSNGSIDMRIGGTGAGSNYFRVLIADNDETVAVEGSATISGTLNVELTGGFIPSAGNAFTVISGPSVGGSFTTTNLPSIQNTWLVDDTSGTSIVLRVQ